MKELEFVCKVWNEEINESTTRKYGHGKKMKENRILKRVVESKGISVRRVGRPPKR